MTAPARLGTQLAKDESTLGRSAALRAPAEPLPQDSPPVSPQVLCAPAGRRRGRPVYLVVATVLTLAVTGMLGWLGEAAHDRIPAETAVVRVGAGETVWDVAQRVAPEADSRVVVERIRRLNGLVDSAVQPGQQLRVPAG